MVALGLFALLVVGVGFTLSSVAGLARRVISGRPRVVESGGAPRAAENVAVLIAAHDREDRVTAALNSAASVVPLANIYLVSDDSTDQTAELARAYGVKVVETFGRQGPAGAIDSGVQAFRLLDGFRFVLLLDVDTRLDPHHLERVLPRFDDPTVAAVVDVRVDTDWHTGGRTPVGRVLTAYRGRAYAVTHWLRVLRRRGPPANVARALPSVARTYRTAALELIEINPPGLATADFDYTLQIYRNRLGRVDFCPEVGACPAQPTRFADHRRQTGQSFTGFLQAVHRDRASVGPVLSAIELVVTSVLLILTPVALVLGALTGARVELAGSVSLLTVSLAVALADYLLTVAVAIAQRQPRYLLAGLAFPLLRVVDAASALAALVRAALGRPRAEWLSFGGHTSDVAPRSADPRPPARPRTTTQRIARPLAVLGWLLVIGSAAAIVVRVARTIATLAPAPTEPTLVAVAYGQYIGHVEPAVGAELTLASLQVRLYTAMTWAFDRGSSVLLAARELSVVVAATVMLGLIVVAAILRVRPLVTALVLAPLVVCGPAITLLTPVGPGGLAAAWLMVAAAAVVAAIAWRKVRWVLTGAIALLLALGTAVILIIPIGVAVAAGIAGADRRLPGWGRVAGGVGALAATGGLAFVLWRREALLVEPAGSGVLDHDGRLVVLCVVAAAAIGGLVIGWLRPVAAGLGAGAGFAFAIGPGADALLPALLAAAVVLVAVMIEDAARWQSDGGAVLARRAVVGLVAAITITGSIAGVTLGPRSWSPPDHSGLARWIANNLEAGVTVVAPAGVWPDLQRDLSRAGRPEGTVRKAATGSSLKPDELLVTVGPDRPSGIELASFASTPTESQTMAVLLTDPHVEYLASGGRAGAGAQLAQNTRLRTTGEVHEALRAGRVDMRAMALLAELCRKHQVTVATTGNPAHESASPMPHRTLVLSEVDGRSVANQSDAAPLLDWLRAQQPPYAPADIKVTPNGLTLSWRLPARLDKSS